ncbi:MAG: SDR family oxidoreductase, partial [Actinobacteria bacterium]|nr:SDR family oxidoreductase [Actinomycetota bacterium]
VNNAGIGHKVAVEQEALDDFRATMELNVTAVWHLSKLIAPSMIAAGGGSIVNVASMLGHVAASPVKQAHYCASKGAVVNLTRELAAQWARKGIRVNALCPGWFRSEMTAGMDDDESSRQFIAGMSPIPRMGEEHELDAALLFLAGAGSTFYTGQSLIVDGGWTAR